jgi:hypothetical protein
MPDLHFLALASIAVLIVGIAKGGFGGGIGIVGVPLMALVVSPARAAAIMLPILMLMDVFALRAYWRQWHLPNLRLLLPGALLGTVLGFATFRLLSPDMLRLLVGLLAIGFGLLQFVRSDHHVARPADWRRALFWGTASGVTSFSVHAGGPPLQVYLLPQKLDRTAFQATSVAFFFVVNWLKLPAYAWLGQLDTTNLATSLLLAPLAPVGIAAGRWLHGRVDDRWFFRIVHGSLLLIGVKLVHDALRAA